jgi:molecular chaperone DnaK
MIFPGIDLGTTFSLIAHVNAYGQPALFPDLHDANNFRTPSLVYVGREGCLVGAAVEELLDDAPELPVARFIKAQMSQANWRYQDHKEREWTPEALSALILKKLLKDADTFAGDDIGPAVITVPAQFTDNQRQATLNAAGLAGLGNVRLVEEPVAAATYYGLDEGPRDRTLLVYDFGGGTFDVTLLQTGSDGLYVLATDGLPHLGGRTIDQRIMDFIDEDFKRHFQRSALSDPASAQRLRRLAEESKIKLSKPGPAQIRQTLLLQGNPYEFLLTRPQFDQIVQEAVAQTIMTCQRCLKAGGLDWRDIDHILLTGGSSLLPHVPVELLRASGKPASSLILKQPHQAVSYGAALLAQRYAQDPANDSLIQQVTGADLCLRVWDKRHNRPGLETLIARNTPLPIAYNRTFYTNRDDQTRIVLEFVQCRGEPPEEFSLGNFTFGPINNPRRNTPLEVIINIARDGLINVTARDPSSGKSIARSLQEGEGTLGQDWEQQRCWVTEALVNV